MFLVFILFKNRYLKSFAGRLDVHHVLREASIAAGKGSAGIGEAWSGGGSQHPPERPGGARKVVAAPLRQGPGADQHFSRRHGRRDHNWQWNMDKSPWAKGLMAKGGFYSLWIVCDAGVCSWSEGKRELGAGKVKGGIQRPCMYEERLPCSHSFFMALKCFLKPIIRR